MLIIPLLAQPSQTLTAVLNQQRCTVNVYQKSTGLFIDLAADGKQVIQGQICRDRCRLVRLEYLGFTGDIAFFDTQGTSDPDHTGLDGRYLMAYLSPDEL